MAVTIDLEGRVALVTGGVRGVGLGITRRLLDAGAEVVTCARREPDTLPASSGRTASFRSADVREVDQATALVAGVVAEHGRLDILVNNAGGAPDAPAATASPRFHSRVVDLNLLAPLHLAQAANAVMQAQDTGGSILMISSVSGLRPSPGAAAYGAAKAALNNLAATLAVEWAPRVRVNSIALGMIRTELAPEHYGGEEGIRRISATVPLGRLADPEEVGNACVFLASPLASYVSGVTVTVHGGGENPAYLDALMSVSSEAGAQVNTTGQVN